MVVNLMKLFMKKRTILLIILCLILGFFIAYQIYVAPNSASKPWTISKTQDGSKKFISKETLVSSIKQKQKLITTEVQLNESITIDNSWGTLAIFKKMQSINFVGTGLYDIDLSALNSKNITIKNSTITISLPNPSIEAVTLDPNKTTYNEPDKGWFRFGDIKLSTEDQELLRKTVQDKMKDKMLEKQYYDTAMENSKKSMISLIKSVVSNTNPTYTVKINFS